MHFLMSVFFLLFPSKHPHPYPHLLSVCVFSLSLALSFSFPLCTASKPFFLCLYHLHEQKQYQTLSPMHIHNWQTLWPWPSVGLWWPVQVCLFLALVNRFLSFVCWFSVCVHGYIGIIILLFSWLLFLNVFLVYLILSCFFWGGQCIISDPILCGTNPRQSLIFNNLQDATVTMIIMEFINNHKG